NDAFYIDRYRLASDKRSLRGHTMKKQKRVTKRSQKRPIKLQQIIVLVDAAENYYELSRVTLERSRVPESRKKFVAGALKDEPIKYRYISDKAIPGSIAAPKFVGALELRYAGFYLRSTKVKR